MPLPHVQMALPPPVAGRFSKANIDTYYQDIFEKQMKPVRRALAAAGMQCAESLKVGLPGDFIADTARRGKFDLDDFRLQLMQIGKMGSLSSIVDMLPGAGKLKSQLENANIDMKVFNRQIAIINSMTMRERRTPDLIKASRKKRIASGSGVQVQDVNKLLKQFDDISSMMKKMNKLGQKGLMRHGLSALMPKSMMPRQRPF